MFGRIIFKIFICFLFFLNLSFSESNYLKFLRNLKSLEVVFLQVNYLPYQDTPDSIYRGLFIFKKPNKFYIKYIQDENGKPLKDYIIGDGKKIKIFIAENNETKVVSYKDLISYFPFSYLFSKNINRYFEFKYKKGKNILYLIPKFESDYSHILIKLKENHIIPIKYIKITYPDKREIYFIIEKVLNYNKRLRFKGFSKNKLNRENIKR
ncbi:MAG TPA: outer membrane lipoprotein carrier protein LolA [Aquificae bacterium]|nr:outer membrane lipoprotein carrier protein LolA [Aquificota bacterium]